jgi:hypothetical protein
MSGWTDFAVVTGAATASLLGLLFVAVSIRVEVIARSPELRSRSAQTMALLLIGLLIAVLLAVPNQLNWELGTELLVLGVVAIGVGVVLDRLAGSETRSAIASVIDRWNATTVLSTLLVVSGLLLTLGHRDGVYLLVPALIAVLVGGVVNAWLILVNLTD